MTLQRFGLQPRLVVVCGALATAAMCGLLTSIRPAAGIGAALALGFVPLALYSLPLALAVVTPIALFYRLPFLSVGPTLAFVVLVVAWIGTASARGSQVARRLTDWRGVALICLTVAWMGLATAWADDGHAAGNAILDWAVAATLLLIFFTTLEDARQIRLVAGGFVLGAFLAVSIGLASTGLRPASSALETATYTEGRLQAGVDPNYLAAALVPAIILAGALLPGTRSLLARWALTSAAAVITIGLAATQSRGGLLAAIAATIAAVFVMRRHRLQVIAGMAIAVGLIGFWLAISPGALDRVSNANGGGNGRADLWTVAWRVFEDHPVHGVGLGGFEQASAGYVLRPGQLTALELIVDRPHLVHNTYLQLLAETGLVSLALYVAVQLVFLGASWRAARLFEARGDPGLATLARGLLVAQIGVLVALFFISAPTSVPFWVLYALSGALLLLARAPDASDHAATVGRRA